MAAQRENAAAGTPDIAEQPLQDRGGADHLHAGRVMRPADRVADRAGALAAGIARDSFGDLEKHLARAAGRALDHLRRIGRVMPPQDLIDAVRVL